MGVLVASYVLNLLSGGLLLSFLALDNSAVYAGQFWRLLTYAFASYNLLGLAMNLLVLWLAGRAMEAALGSWRFVALFVTAGLGGATLLFAVAPLGLVAAGAQVAVIGLLAANAIVKRRGGEDIRPDVGLLVLLVLYGLLLGFYSFGWVGLIGGIVVGAMVGGILAYAPRDRRTPIQVVGLLAVVLICLAVVVAKIMAF